MDRRVFLGTATSGAVGAAVCLSRTAGASGRLRAKVTGDASKVTASLDPRIYGQNLEFMGRQFEGGILAEEGSEAPVYGPGLRRDVRDALKDLRPRRLRWPGGCFADAYDWRDGVGPNRPKHANPFWGSPVFDLAKFAAGEYKTRVGPPMDNRFGTHEFIDYCRELGAEPSITASMGPKDPDEAAAWVAYVRDEFGADSGPVWSAGNEQWNPPEPNGCNLRPER